MTSAAFPGSQPAGRLRDLVFISYSHHDRDWLARLLVFLKPFTGPDFRIWADPYIKIGEEWRRNILGAMSRTCVAVLLVSPDFLASDFIRDEELPQLFDGAKAGMISLFPIAISASNYKATPLTHYQFAHPPERPLDNMPRPRRHAALVKIAEKIAEASQNARRHSSAAPAPVAERPATAIVATSRAAALHGVPGQRPNYLRRQEYLDRLKQAVLGSIDRTIGITGATPGGTRVGLHGMGGIGKTVLAIDLVNDDEVRHAFPDGIFWLTLGQSVEPLRLQGELAGYIAGEVKAFATVNEARDQLRQLLEGKACLLVLDDLWRHQDAEPFDVLGPRSRLLVTTRDADLLVALGARELPLDVLSEELAIELLASWSGHARATLPPAADRAAEACGYLPLALALAGARVQGGASWEEALFALKRGRLEFLDHPYGSVFSSLRLSTDALTAAERERYFELAVFPEDADIPVAAICTLWGQTGRTERDASRDLLCRLHRRALLTLQSDGSGISFHDLQHDFLRLNVSSLFEAHCSVIKAYHATAPSGWASGPDDGYFFQHLPQHLAAADRLDELKTLLCDYDWLAAKLRATNITSVLADYDLIPNERDFGLIQQALRLSTPALSRDLAQLPGQLIGRLQGAESPAVKALIRGAEQGPRRPWLRPRFVSLTPPGGPLRQILVGHTGSVEGVAFFPDGRRALSGSEDNTWRLWDLATGETLGILEGHTDAVEAAAVLPGGNCALSGSRDGTLRLWDLGTGETLRILEGHTGWVSAVAVLANGRRALSGSDDGSLRLWDLATGETIRTLEGHTDGVNAVAVLAGGRRALSASDDESLRLWDLATGETLHILKGHTQGVSAVDVPTDGRCALSGSYDKTLRLWDLASGRILRVLGAHGDPVNTVAVTADGSRALSGSFDATLRLWDLTIGETLRTLEGHSDRLNAVAVLADGSRALSGSDDSTLRLWDLETGETLRTLKGHANGVDAVAVLADGRHALSGSGDATLRLWDLTTGESLRTLEGHSDRVNAVAVLSDHSRALSGSLDNTLRLWNLATGKTLRTFEGHTSSVSAVAFHPDGSRALSCSWDNTLRLWDLATGETLCTLDGHTSSVSAVAVLGDGRRALSGSHDNTLRLWDLATGTTLCTLAGHTDWVTAVAVLTDGTRALSSAWDNTLRLWDLATARCLAEYVADVGINCVAFARDDLVVAGSADGRLHILEIRKP